MSVAGAASPAGAVPGEVLMSIGEVLAHLRADFPDTTISKLRFLEAEGLVEPRRTAAGYRKYSWADVTRLRYVLTAQRDHYLPLRVIRDQLAALDEGVPAEIAVGGRIRPSLAAVDTGDAAATEPGEAGRDRDDRRPSRDHLRLSRDELLGRSGLGEAALRTLEQFGLVEPRSGGGYDADALEVAAAAACLAQYGLESRHLRAYRAAADREIGLFGQLVAPLARQGGPAARARAAETFQELAALTARLQGALVRAGLRETLGR
jgi:DNA-binding transcriptional MerR regulator